MVHFAVLCPEASGHVNPMSTLLTELLQRGHQVTWIGTLDGADMLRPRGIETKVVGEDRYPRGRIAELMREGGKLSGLAAARYTVDRLQEALELVFTYSPTAIRECGATALIADEAIFPARTVAELVDLPLVTVCNALPFLQDDDHPPMLTMWKYRSSGLARFRNRIARMPSRLLLRRCGQTITEVRDRHGLERYDWLNDNPSRLLTIAQIPRELDYPRRNQPPWFHYVGAMHNPTSRPATDFPFDQLDDRPLIYASLGTVQNQVLPAFRSIAEACADLPAQLVISLGGGSDVAQLGPLPGNPLVVPFAPQLELLKRARLVITHAGMNTTLESLAHGVPMVAIPITNDQPAVAGRIVWSGCGEAVRLRQANTRRLRKAIHQVFENESYTLRARELSRANQQAGGAERAADLIERVVGGVPQLETLSTS